MAPQHRSTPRERVRLFANGVQARSRPLRLRRPHLPFPFGAPSTPDQVDPLPEASKVGADFDTEWARRPSARAVRSAMIEGIMRPMVAAVAQPERRGLDRLESLDPRRPAIFVANHHSHVDTPLLLTSIPDPWRYRIVVAAAADYFFGNRVSGSLAALSLGAIPMERTRVGRSSATQAADLVKDGFSLAIFPEGGRSKDGWGQPFKGGAAYLAQRCDVPVVPVYLAGTGRILRKGRALPQRSHTIVNFGAPLWPEPDETSRAFNTRIEDAVATLADESGTDWWQAKKRAHAGESPPLTGPEGGSWRRQWALGARSARPQRRSWP